MAAEKQAHMPDATAGTATWKARKDPDLHKQSHLSTDAQGLEQRWCETYVVVP